MLRLPLVPLVELLCFGMAHLLFSSVVVESCSALLVAGQHAIFFCACASGGLRRSTRTMVRLCAVSALSFRLGELGAKLLVLRRGNQVVVGGAQLWRSICVYRKGSWSIISGQLAHEGDCQFVTFQHGVVLG
jgi:hypothetical protein